MKRRAFIAAVPVVGMTTIAGCSTSSETADDTASNSSSTQESTMTRTDKKTTGRIGIKIDNQTAKTADVSVRITENDDDVDKLDVSVDGESIESFKSAISSPGTYDLEVTTTSQSETFTHAVDEWTIENELQIVIVVYSDTIRSYIQE